MLALDLGTRDVATIDQDAPLVEAAERMHVETLGCLVVVDAEGRGVGLVTDRDLCLRGVATERESAHLATVRTVMSAPLESLAPDDTVAEAARRMRAMATRRLPICDEGRPVGLIALDDILAVLAGTVLDLEAASLDRRVEESRNRRTDRVLTGLGGLRERLRAATWHAREEFLEDLDRLEDLILGPGHRD